ncbi:MAG: NapC/NirT family cytochrome c [Nitrospirae bacterium]|nr:NapC/NirT family cytochrome c [Nitrospirota bacterium]
MKWEKKIAGLVDHIKGFVLAAFLIISILAIVLAYRYYEYRQEDPNFCVSCHLMKEAYKEWQKGKHRDIVCQQCHHVSMLEQNRLLVAFVMKQNEQAFSQSHGREKPWRECKKCHMDNVAQGSLSLQKSYGHAKHVFMQGIECKVCHKGNLHNFTPNESACSGCHKDKGVHGIGMEAFSCLKCHSYSEKTASMIPKDRCIKCHPSVSVKGPMSGILCHQCHKPHGTIMPALALCTTECHSNEATVGQHGLHMKKGLNCLDCHKAHTWVVGENRAQTLCSRCHPYKNPRLFIY